MKPVQAWEVGGVLYRTEKEAVLAEIEDFDWFENFREVKTKAHVEAYKKRLDSMMALLSRYEELL